jgi:hypothetical protein
MSNYQSYQQPSDTATRDAHEAHVLRQSEHTGVTDHSGGASFASHQTAPAVERPRVNWNTGEKLSYQSRRDYNEKGHPEIGDRFTSQQGMRAVTRSTQDPMTGEVTRSTEVVSPYGESIDAGELPQGSPVDLSSIDTARLADKIAEEGGLAIRDLSAVQAAGLPEDFVTEVADVIAGRETRTASEVPAQFAPFVAEFHASGALSEKSLDTLERMGVSRQLVHRMIRGRAKIEAHANARIIHHPDAILLSLDRASARQRAR